MHSNIEMIFMIITVKNTKAVINVKNNTLPQFGIITSISTSNRSAKVYLPLQKIETGYLKIANEIPIKDSNNDGITEKSQVIVTFVNGETSNGIITSWL